MPGIHQQESSRVVATSELDAKNNFKMTDESLKEMLLQVRQAILMIVDAIERHYGIERTAKLRKQLKRMKSDE